MIDTKIILNRFKEELNKRMLERGDKYKQVALFTRTSNHEMLEYLQGDSFPEIWSLVLIADYLGCSVDEMLGYSNSHATDCKKIPASNVFYSRNIFADYFREHLIKRMSDKHIDVNELAALSGITKTRIEMYVSVHRWVPSVPYFLRICDALDCTPTDLLGY